MKKLAIIAAVFALIYTLGCAGQKQAAGSDQTPKALNPNGDSELALLMRAMFDDGMAMKKAIESGDLPESHVDLANLYTQDAAEPDKVNSPEYKAFASMYEAAVEAVNNSEGERKVAAYKSLVATCMNCHKAMCPGPIVRIKKLEL